MSAASLTSGKLWVEGPQHTKLGWRGKLAAQVVQALELKMSC